MSEARQELNTLIEGLEKLLPGSLDGDEWVGAILIDYFTAIVGGMAAVRVRSRIFHRLSEEDLSDLKDDLELAVAEIRTVLEEGGS